MPKGLLIKGKNKTAIIRYDEQYADDPRFELIEDVAAYLQSLKKPTRKKRTAKKKVAPTAPAEPAVNTDELDDLIAGIENGEKDNR